MKRIAIALSILTLVGCNEKTFKCDKQPFMGQPERQCSRTSDTKEEESFHPTHAWCFHYSRSRWSIATLRGIDISQVPGTGYWSSMMTVPLCTPTKEECESFRNAVGNGSSGQPPTKTPCVDTPAEQDPTGSSL